MTLLARLVEVPTGFEQGVDVFLLHDIEDLERDVSERLDLGVP